MQLLDLHPHSGRSHLPISIDVVVERSHHDLLAVIFRVSGAIDHIAWPPSRDMTFADELWRHTCFEIFAKAADRKSYREINLSPSGQFAAYAFDDYRAGMRRADDVNVGSVSIRKHEDRVELSAAVFFHGISRTPLWAIGLSAVIEQIDGSTTYWALAHPPGPPDFHDRDCFVARLAAPERP